MAAAENDTAFHKLARHEKGARCVRATAALSFYFFDIDDNLLFLPTRLYVWNAEAKQELAVSSRDFANVQNDFGREMAALPISRRDKVIAKRPNGGKFCS